MPCSRRSVESVKYGRTHQRSADRATGVTRPPGEVGKAPLYLAVELAIGRQVSLPADVSSARMIVSEVPGASSTKWKLHPVQPRVIHHGWANPPPITRKSSPTENGNGSAAMLNRVEQACSEPSNRVATLRWVLRPVSGLTGGGTRRSGQSRDSSPGDAKCFEWQPTRVDDSKPVSLKLWEHPQRVIA